jgi:hypothetical protein
VTRAFDDPSAGSQSSTVKKNLLNFQKRSTHCSQPTEVSAIKKPERKFNPETYSDSELADCLVRVNQHKYPENFKILEAEVERRKSRGSFFPTDNYTYEARDLPGLTIIKFRAGVEPVYAIVLGIWLCFWLTADFLLIDSLLSGQPIHWKGGAPAGRLDALLFTIFWVALGSVFLYVFLWIVAGNTVYLFTAKRLTIRYTLAGRTFSEKVVLAREVLGYHIALEERRRRSSTWQVQVLRLQTRADKIKLIEDLPGGNLCAEFLTLFLKAAAKRGHHWRELRP